MLEESLPPEETSTGLTSKAIQKLQILLRINNGDIPLRNYDLESLWLTPDILPKTLYDALSKGTPEQPYRQTWQKRFGKAAQNLPLLSDKSHVEARFSAEDIEDEVSGADQQDDFNDSNRFVQSISSPIPNQNQYKYDNLQSPYAIRVLELEASQREDTPIRCRLVRTDLSVYPEYEALSYVWGSMTDAIEIHVDQIGRAHV